MTMRVPSAQAAGRGSNGTANPAELAAAGVSVVRDGVLKRREFLLVSGVAGLEAQTPRPIRIAVVGTGNLGQQHCGMLVKMPQYEVAAFADLTPASRDRAATILPKAVAYSDYRKMLEEQQDLDAVLVVVPNFRHAEVTIAALERGLHVLCEKPMATRVEDANRMIEAAWKAGKILEIGHEFRHAPVYQRMTELLREGAIGSIQYVSGHTFRGDWNPQGWRYMDPKTGTSTNWRFLRHTAGTSLMEDGIHEIDVFHGMIGAKVARIFATGGNNVLKERETIDHAGILIDYENGVKFQFGFSLFASGASPSRFGMLIGTEGTMQPDGSKVVIRKPGGAPKVVDTSGAQGSPHLRQFLAFSESVRTGKRPLCDGELGKQAVKIALLAQKSIDENRIVSWNDLPA